MRITGIWSDRLRSDEVEFSQKIAKQLINKQEHQNFIRDPKIQRMLSSLKSPSNMSKEDVRAAKSHLFEIRFAHAIDQLGLNINYEYEVSADSDSVNLLIENQEMKTWAVKLISLRDGEHINQNTTLNEGIYSHISPDNNAEIKDIYRAQQAILSKVAKDNRTPIKFPEINYNSRYNIIIVDMRAVNFGMVDLWDLQIVLMGSSHLNEYYREFTDKNGVKHPMLGLCDLNYDDPRAKYFRERIHAVGFINEKEYCDGEINANLKVFFNHNLVSKDSLLKFPLGTSTQFLWGL